VATPESRPATAAPRTLHGARTERYGLPLDGVGVGTGGGRSDGHGESGSVDTHWDGGGVNGTTVHFLVGAKLPPHVRPNG